MEILSWFFLYIQIFQIPFVYLYAKFGKGDKMLLGDSYASPSYAKLRVLMPSIFLQVSKPLVNIIWVSNVSWTVEPKMFCKEFSVVAKHNNMHENASGFKETLSHSGKNCLNYASGNLQKFLFSPLNFLSSMADCQDICEWIKLYCLFILDWFM